MPGRRDCELRHNRSDTPISTLQVNLTYSPKGRIERSPIAATPDAITAHALEAPALESTGRLLE